MSSRNGGGTRRTRGTGTSRTRSLQDGAGAVRRAISHRPGSARAAAAADLRRVFRGLPRTPAPRDIEGRADRILRRAAAHEMAREGVDLVERLVDLPDPFTRAELIAAQIPALPSYEAFVVAASQAPRIRVRETGAVDAIAAARAPSARDAYGPTLEAAGDAVSYLVTRAWDLLGPESTGAPDRDAYLAAQQERARSTVRAALTDAVTVPQELRVAMELHAAVLRGDRAPGADGDESGAGGGGADGVTGASAATGAPGADDDLLGGPADGTDDADDDPTAEPGESSTSAADDANDRWTGDGGAESPRRSLVDRARSVQEFLQSDIGRGAQDFLRSDAGKAAMQFMAEHGKDAAATARDLYTAAQKRDTGGSSRSSRGGGSSKR